MFTVNRYANKINKIVRLLIAKERRTFRFWNVPFKAKGLLSTKAFVNLLLFPFIQDATNDAYVRRHMKPELEEKRRKRLVIIFIVIIFCRHQVPSKHYFLTRSESPWKLRLGMETGDLWSIAVEIYSYSDVNAPMLYREGERGGG